MNILHAQTGIGLVEPDRRAVRSRREVNELLQILSARRGRCALCELKQEIEDRSNVLGEVGNVLIEISVIHREETNLVVLKRHELCEMRSADLVQVCGGPMSPGAQNQLRFDVRDS